MTITETQRGLLNTISNDNTWEEIASAWNLHHQLGETLFNATFAKAREEGLYQNEIIQRLRDAGCRLSYGHISHKLEFYDFQNTLRLLRPDETVLPEPETERQFRATDGDNAIEQAENFADIAEEVGSEQPSAETIRERNKKLNDFREQFKKDGTTKVKGKVIFTAEQLIEFRKWLLEEKKLDIKKERPKTNFMELAQQREEVITELANRSGEWKMVRSIMQKRLHPDKKDGNILAFQFYEILDRLMQLIISAVEYVKFEEKINDYKKEWIELIKKEK